MEDLDFPCPESPKLNPLILLSFPVHLDLDTVAEIAVPAELR